MIGDNAKFLRQVYIITLSVILLITSLLYLIVPSYKVIIFSALGFILIIGLFLNKKGNIRVSGQIYLWSCFLALIVYTCSTGGIIAPGFIWFAICPIISGIIFNSKSARVWLSAIGVVMVSLVIWEDQLVFDAFKGGNYWYLISFGTFFYTTVKLLLSLRVTIKQHASALEAKNKQLFTRQRKIINQNEVITQQYESIKEQTHLIKTRNEKLEQYFDLVMDIGRMDEIHSGNFHFSINRLSETLLNVLGAERVIFWEYGTRQDNLVAIDVNESGNKTQKLDSNTIKEFSKNSCGEQLMAGVALVLSEPQQCTNLREWESMQNGSYAFKSIMCCPYFVDGRFGGIISCESVNADHFGMEEKLLVRAFADGLSLSYRSKQRYDQQLLLQQKQRYIEELNTSLEQKVEERTEQIFLKNIKLEKFAYINAHEIRGPICRLQGLRNLIGEVDTQEEFVTVRDYISKSIDELDEITKQSNRLLEEASTI